jgi:hypothetical protein
MELYCSEDIKELTGAMLKVQSEINPALKDGENPFAKSRYATLNSVITASRAALLKYDIWLVQYPVPVEPGFLGLMTKLVHGPSGQWQGSLLVMPLSKTDPQGYGSALTYSRRYALASMVGLVVEDDDGETACGRSRNKANNSRSTQKSTLSGNTGYQEKQANHQAGSNFTVPETVLESKSFPDSEATKNLPKLEGISYQTVTTPEGQICIIATGNTTAKKDILNRTGFKWNSNRKIWWRYASTSTNTNANAT